MKLITWLQSRRNYLSWQRWPAWLIGLIILVIPGLFDFTKNTYSAFELNKQVLFVTCLLITIFLLMAQMIIKRRLEMRSGMKYLWLAVGLLVVWAVMTTVASTNPTHSFFGHYMRQQGVMALLFYWLWLVILCNYWSSEGQVKRFLILAVLGSLPVVVYGIVQHFGWDPLLWMEPGTGRAFSTQGQPNFLGAYLVMIILMSLALLGQLKSWWSRVVVGLIIIGQVYILVYTYSRSAWIALGFALAFYVLAWFFKKRYYKLIVSALLLITITLSLVIGFNKQLAELPMKSNAVYQRVISIFDLSFEVTSSRARTIYWQTGWDIYSEASWWRQMIGYGKDGQAMQYLTRHRDDWAYYEKLSAYPDRAHNNILDILLEFGWVGLLLYGSLNYLVLSRAWRYYLREIDRRRATMTLWLISAVIGYFVVHSFGFAQTTQMIYYYLLLSLLWYLSSDSETKIKEIKNSAWFLWIIYSLILVFSALIVWQFSWKYYIADRYYMKAKMAEADRNCQVALNSMNRVMYWQPMNPNYQEQYLLIYNNCLAPAFQSDQGLQLVDNLMIQMEAIAEQEPNYEITINLARAYSMFGYYVDQQYYQRADEYYARLVEWTPYMVGIYQDWARMKLWAGEYDKVIEIADMGLAKYPDINKLDFSNNYVVDTRIALAYLKQMKGDAFYHRKDFKSALEQYLAIYDLFTSADLEMNIADSYYQLGDKQSSLKYLQGAVSDWPHNSELLLKLATLYQELGDREQARIMVKQLLEVYPEHETAKRLLLEFGG